MLTDTYAAVHVDLLDLSSPYLDYFYALSNLFPSKLGRDFKKLWVLTEPLLNPSVASIILVHNGRYSCLALGTFVIVSNKAHSIISLKINQILLAVRNVGTESIVYAWFTNRHDWSRSPRNTLGSRVITKSSRIIKIIHSPLVCQASHRILTCTLFSPVVTVEFIHKYREEAMHPIPCAHNCARA